jgi:hypothetical protein
VELTTEKNNHKNLNQTQIVVRENGENAGQEHVWSLRFYCLELIFKRCHFKSKIVFQYPIIY